MELFVDIEFCLCIYLGRSNVVGELDYGHTGIVGVGHGVTHVRPVVTETLRPHETSDITHHDEEHHRPGRLPTDGHLLAVVCRRQNAGHTDRPRRRIRFRAHSTLHRYLQHFRHDDAIQRDQRT